jgi:ABC-type uncharacterized transport system permease subunit
MKKDRIFWGTVAPLAAVVSSLLLVSMILMLRGANPIEIFQIMISYGFDPRN